MSYTNHTTNYNLPQYIGTDKPTYLTDFNGAMNAIDAQMKLNADSASTASTNANTANTSIGTLSNLTTEMKTNVVGAINEVDSHADTAQATANQANETAGNALSTATGASTATANLASYITLSSITAYDQTAQFTTNKGSISTKRITVARNSAGTYAKVYGYVVINNLLGQSSTITAKLNVDTGLRPTERIAIDGTSMAHLYTASGVETTIISTVYVNPDGTVEVSTGLPSAGTTETIYFRLLACILYIKDFGDIQ